MSRLLCNKKGKMPRGDNTKEHAHYIIIVLIILLQIFSFLKLCLAFDQHQHQFLKRILWSLQIWIELCCFCSFNPNVFLNFISRFCALPANSWWITGFPLQRENALLFPCNTNYIVDPLLTGIFPILMINVQFLETKRLFVGGPQQQPEY